MSFQALLLTRDGDFRCAITELDEAALPERAVTIDVEYSTVNYKDALAVLDRGRIVREWPMIPGIDLAGVVSASTDESWSPGDRVVVNGWELGESRWGGLAEKAAVDPGWPTRLPEGISTHDAAAIGTAGYTAMLCVQALENHGLVPGDGPVVVTGAAGGVGSVAIALLAHAGHEVVASTGRVETEGDYLRRLGASEVIHREELSREAKPLEGARWAGAVDTVGSTTLATVLAQTVPHGCVAACGLAGGADLPTTVMPFILRGVVLAGVNSVYETPAVRDAAWARLATDLDEKLLAAMTDATVGLGSVTGVATRVLSGQVRGRVVVDVRR